MRPLEPLRELAEESGGRDRATLAPADIGEVGEVALELVGVFLGEWQLPRAIIRAHAGGDDLAGERIIVAHDPGVMSAKCDDAGTGEGCDVDDRVRIEAPRVV